MPSPTPPLGREDLATNDEVLGKLDRLLNRHRAGALPADPSRVPMLTATPDQEAVAEESGIPTLTDVVARPAARAAKPAPGTEAPGGLDTGLAAAILRHLLATLRAERARLAADFGDDPEKMDLLAHILDELELALPAAISGAVNAGNSAGVTAPQDDGRI
jgi:hypothetical protein